MEILSIYIYIYRYWDYIILIIYTSGVEWEAKFRILSFSKKKKKNNKKQTSLQAGRLKLFTRS